MDFDLYAPASVALRKDPPLPQFGDLMWYPGLRDGIFGARPTNKAASLIVGNAELFAAIGLTVQYSVGTCHYYFSPGATVQQIDDVLGEARRRLRQRWLRAAVEATGPVRSISIDTRDVTAHLDHASDVFTCPIRLDKRLSFFIARRIGEAWAVLLDDYVIIEGDNRDELKTKLRAYLKGLAS